MLGFESPQTVQSLNYLGETYHEQGKYEQAEPLLHQAMVIHEHLFGLEHPRTATSINNLAVLSFYQGKYEQAEPLYRRALAIREQALGLEHQKDLLDLREKMRQTGDGLGFWPVRRS